MKKLLILTAFGAASLAGAQNTAPASASEQTPTVVISPDEAYARAQELAAQAEVAYPVAFYDRTLWKAAVNSAFAATSDGANRDYSAYLAELYTKTQWWINAYNAWERLGSLSVQERNWASIAATKLAYLALQRGDKVAAARYIAQGQSWADNATLRKLKTRLK